MNPSDEKKGTRAIIGALLLVPVLIGGPLWLVNQSPAPVPVVVATSAPSQSNAPTYIEEVPAATPPDGPENLFHPTPISQAEANLYATQVALVPKVVPRHNNWTPRRASRAAASVQLPVEPSSPASATFPDPTPTAFSSFDSGGTSGVRTGATCNDGTHSDATGRGACSHHGGVAHWE